MWHRKKTDQKENGWEILKELSEKSQESEDEKTLLLSKEDAEGTRMMWTGAARHCRIFERNGKFYVEDLHSSNGSLA